MLPGSSKRPVLPFHDWDVLPLLCIPAVTVVPVQNDPYWGPKCPVQAVSALKLPQGSFQRDAGVAFQQKSFALYPGLGIAWDQEFCSCLLVSQFPCWCVGTLVSSPGDAGGATRSVWRSLPLTPPSLHPSRSLPARSFSTTTAPMPSIGGCEVREGTGPCRHPGGDAVGLPPPAGSSGKRGWRENGRIRAGSPQPLGEGGDSRGDRVAHVSLLSLPRVQGKTLLLQGAASSQRWESQGCVLVSPGSSGGSFALCLQCPAFIPFHPSPDILLIPGLWGSEQSPSPPARSQVLG